MHTIDTFLFLSLPVDVQILIVNSLQRGPAVGDAFLKALHQKINERHLLRLYVDLSDRLPDLFKPADQSDDRALEYIHQLVGSPDVTVEISDVGHDAAALHCGHSRSHVYGRDPVDALTGVGLHVHSLGSSGSFKISVLRHFPCVPPDFTVAVLVPV